MIFFENLSSDFFGPLILFGFMSSFSCWTIRAFSYFMTKFVEERNTTCLWEWLKHKQCPKPVCNITECFLNLFIHKISSDWWVHAPFSLNDVRLLLTSRQFQSHFHSERFPTNIYKYIRWMRPDRSTALSTPDYHLIWVILWRGYAVALRIFYGYNHLLEKPTLCFMLINTHCGKYIHAK